MKQILVLGNATELTLGFWGKEEEKTIVLSTGVEFKRPYPFQKTEYVEDEDDVE